MILENQAMHWTFILILQISRLTFKNSHSWLVMELKLKHRGLELRVLERLTPQGPAPSSLSRFPTFCHETIRTGPRMPPIPTHLSHTTLTICTALLTLVFFFYFLCGYLCVSPTPLMSIQLPWGRDPGTRTAPGTQKVLGNEGMTPHSHPEKNMKC